MSKRSKVELAVVLFFPVSLSLYFNRSWQETLILLVCSLAFILILNIEKYEIFKLSKDGVEIKTKIQEINNYSDAAKQTITNLLNLQIDTSMRLGGNVFTTYEEIKNIIQTIEIAKLDNLEISDKVSTMKKNLFRSVLLFLRRAYVDIVQSQDSYSAEIEPNWTTFMDSAFHDYDDDQYFEFLNLDPGEPKVSREELIKLIRKLSTEVEKAEFYTESALFEKFEKLIEIIEFTIEED